MDADLKRAIEDSEQSGVEALEHYIERHPPDLERLQALVELCAKEPYAVGATWLLRNYLRSAGELDRTQTAAFLRTLPKLVHDHARLHACMLVADLIVPKRNAEALARFLRECAGGEHKFSRAWAVDAFHRLGQQHPDYRMEAQRWIRRAERDPAASVRARMRQLRKEIEP